MVSAGYEDVKDIRAHAKRFQPSNDDVMDYEIVDEVGEFQIF